MKSNYNFKKWRWQNISKKLNGLSEDMYCVYSTKNSHKTLALGTINYIILINISKVNFFCDI